MRIAIAIAVMSCTLAGCGSTDPRRPASDGDNPWAALDRVPGSLLFACGPSTTSADVYLKDPTGAVRRLTESPQNFGVSGMAWLGRQIAVVTTRKGPEDLEVRDLDTPPAAPGKLVDRSSGSPAVSGDGELAYMRAGERRGRFAHEVVRTGGGHRRVVTTLPTAWQLAWVGRRLYAQEEAPDGRVALVDVTNRRSHRRTRLKGNIGATAVSPTGRVAYTRIRRRSLSVTVMRLDGTHRRTFRTRWLPLEWSPDERQILVRKVPRFGLMSPETGEVRDLGRLPCGGVLLAAEWREDGP
jgi:hypothetical protein